MVLISSVNHLAQKIILYCCRKCKLIDYTCKTIICLLKNTDNGSFMPLTKKQTINHPKPRLI